MKNTPQSSQTLPLAKLRRSDVWPTASRARARRPSSWPASRGRVARATSAGSGRSVSTLSDRTPSTTAGSPSTRNSHCQPLRPRRPSSFSSASDTGAPTITATGRRHHEERAGPGAVAWRGSSRSDRGSSPGRSRPRRCRAATRAAMNDRTSVMNIVAIETKPQPIMMRAIQRRAPTRSRMRLLGISNRQ